jgi:cell division protein FtsL
MTMRLINLIVVIALVLAAAYVYKVKFDSTVQAERVAKLRTEIRREREGVAALRAEWSKLDNPARIQGLAKRHLALKPIDASQFETFDRLPERPAAPVLDLADPIGAMLDDDHPTGSVAPAAPAR